MQPPIVGWTKTDDKGIARLKHDAIDHIFIVPTNRKPVDPYVERPSNYMVTLKGDKKKRRVYITPIGNVAVQYLKTRQHGVTRHIFCETALDEALNRAEDD